MTLWKRLLKRFLEKEKPQVLIILSFSKNVFNRSKHKFQLLSEDHFVICYCLHIFTGIKLFQNRISSFREEDFLRISSSLYSASSPICQSYVYWRIKILQIIFEKGHPRNIPVKLFQNRTSGFREEDFLTISYCPYCARSPHSQEALIWMDQNFATTYWKGSAEEHSCEIISKSDRQFQKRRSGFRGEDF